MVVLSIADAMQRSSRVFTSTIRTSGATVTMMKRFNLRIGIRIWGQAKNHMRASPSLWTDRVALLTAYCQNRVVCLGSDLSTLTYPLQNCLRHMLRERDRKSVV